MRHLIDMMMDRLERRSRDKTPMLGRDGPIECFVSNAGLVALEADEAASHALLLPSMDRPAGIRDLEVPAIARGEYEDGP